MTSTMTLREALILEDGGQDTLEAQNVRCLGRQVARYWGYDDPFFIGCFTGADLLADWSRIVDEEYWAL